MTLLAILLATSALLARQGEIAVAVGVRDDEPICTVHARGARVDQILLEIARQSNLTLEGLDARTDLPSVDVDLENRPLALVVERIATTAGMHAQLKSSSIAVRSDIEGDASVDDVVNAAEAAYLRALRQFSRDSSAAEAKLRLGQIQEGRGNPGAAVLHYEALVHDHPDSPQVPEGLLHAGLLREELRQWSDAAPHFSHLANSYISHPHQARARLELARCLAHGSDGKQALAILDVLDRRFHATSTVERVERAIVRAFALLASGKPTEAIELLDEAATEAPERCVAADVLEIRAVALERAGAPIDAARTWLAIADRVDGTRREEALTKSARLALGSGDALGALFVARSGSAVAKELPPLGEIARKDLGVPTDETPTIDESLALADECCATGDFARAEQTIDTLWRVRKELEERDRMRLVLVRARCADASNGIEAAIGLLRASLESLKEADYRRQVYLLAGSLYERRAQWDRAADAYGGRL